MTEFRYSICEPLNPKVIEKGMIAPDSVIGLFNDFQWDYYLKQIEVAAVGDPEDPEFYIFYKRPISVVKKQFFRKPQTVVEDYVSEITGQTKEDVIECLNALIKNDQEFLRRKIA